MIVWLIFAEFALGIITPVNMFPLWVTNYMLAGALYYLARSEGK